MEEAVRCNEIGDVLSIACISNQCQGWRGNQSIGLSLCQERTIGRSADLELMLTGISVGFWFENSQNAAESTFIAVKCVWVLPTYFINTTPLSSYAFRVKYGRKKPRWLSSFTYDYSLSVLFLFPFSLINFVTKFAICIESCFFLSPVWFKNWGFTCIPWLLQHCKAGRQGQKLCQLHLLSFDALLNLYVCHWHWQRNGQSLISWQFDFNGERQNIKKFRKNEHYIKGIHWFACNLNKYLIPKHNIT